ncbi:MAG: hypothetical protein ACOCT0_00090, partial [Halobacteriota archaeon]
MKSTALLRKEVEVARDNLPAVLGLLVLLPAAFAGSTLVFEDVLPRDSPVAVVSDDPDASTEQLEAVADVLAPFADTTVHEGDWRRALEREEVYLAIQVPGDLEDGEVVVHHHGAVVPFDEPSELLVSSLDGLSR